MPQATTAPRVAQVPAGVPGGNPQQAYRALVSQREVLGQQLSDAQQLRNNLVEQLSGSDQTAATRTGLEKRIANVDARIAELDKQVAQSDQAVATTAAIPGAVVRPPPSPRTGMPEETFALIGMFMVIVLLPLSIAFSRRIWRKAARVEATLPPEMKEHLDHLERGMEAIAIEVERIGEGQRFVTQALAERGDVNARAFGAGAAEPVAVPLLNQRNRGEERR